MQMYFYHLRFSALLSASDDLTNYHSTKYLEFKSFEPTYSIRQRGTIWTLPTLSFPVDYVLTSQTSIIVVTLQEL